MKRIILVKSGCYFSVSRDDLFTGVWRHNVSKVVPRLSLIGTLESNSN